MANVFGPFSPGGQFTQSFPLFDPRQERANRARLSRLGIPQLAYANSFAVPSGQYRAVGYILLHRADYNALDPFATNLALQLDDFANGPVTFQKLSVTQAWCVSRGLLADTDAIYLLEITDQRGLLHNPWWDFPTTSQYNVRAPAYPQQYYAFSLNGGVPWSWDGMVGNLWGQMATFLGSYPGLPGISPVGNPENWIFPGCSCWLALNQVLSYLGCTVACDLTKATAQYTVVQFGAADTPLTAKQAKFAGLLEEDLEILDTGAGRAPKNVTVFFHQRYQYYGTEETVRNDGGQWQGKAIYSVNVAGPFPKASGTAFIWADFTVRLDEDGNPLAADTAQAASVAAQEATDYYSRIRQSLNSHRRQVYAGALPFANGSLIDGCRWFQTEGRFGWRTELMTGPHPPFEMLDDD